MANDFILVKDHVCFATKGKGRLFVPVSLLEELNANVSIDKYYEIKAAPGVKPMPLCADVADPKLRSEIGSQRIKYYQWYWKALTDAMNHIEKLIPDW